MTSYTNGKGDLKISTPAIDKSTTLQTFENEKVLEQILTAYKKEETGETEGDALVDTLVGLIQSTPSLKIFNEFAESIG
jgi:hypothetical protein